MTRTPEDVLRAVRSYPTAENGHAPPPPVDDPGPPEPPPDGDGRPGDGRRATGLAERLLSRADLKTLPDPEPLIDNVLDQGSVALLYGRWGTGKSFIAIDWAASVATGRVWQGRATERRRVLYVAAEGAFGLKGRMSAWETGWQQIVAAEDTFDVLPQPVNLTNFGQVAELCALIDQNGYGLIVVDTLARCMVGADENSAKDCGQVVDALTRLRQATPDGRGVVLGVHHTGKDGKTFRGSSVFEAGADTVYSVTPDGGLIVLDREKRKDGPQHDRHELRIDPIPGTGSAAISAGNLSKRGVDKSDRAATLLSVFVQNFGESGATKAELRTVADMAPATFHRAVNELLKIGSLINTGSEKRPFYQAVGK